MNLTGEIFARVLELAGDADEDQRRLLQALSEGANAAIRAGVRREAEEGETREMLVTAGSLLALAGFLETDGSRSVERFSVGEVTVQPGSGSAAARALRDQARAILGPCGKDRFAFRRI